MNCYFYRVVVTAISFLYFVRLFAIAETEQGFVFIEDQAEIPILSPTFSQRVTSKIRLDNGLEAYLISDPNTDLSGAALTVKAGSWEDPKEDPGMAHFLEHMLFLGTKKYPRESEFDQFISEHGGIANAYTTNDHTAYIFAVDNRAIAESLDRFSSFFKEPLFNPSGVSRELQAIDQEYAKNLQNDEIRELYVYKALSDPNHPNHAFSMGNRQSLTGVSQDSLKKWYKTHYSANAMRLVVLSDQPIEKIQAMVVEDFSGIPNISKEPAIPQKVVFPEEAKGKMVFIEPVKNIRQLTMVWELPPRFANLQETKPETIVGFLLGHEGKGSLFNLLRKEKLAESLKCGGLKIGPGSMQLFLQIDLTEYGVHHVEEVIQTTFQAINFYRKTGIPQYLYDEINSIATLNYQFQKRKSVFETLGEHAAWLAQEDLATYPEESHVIRKFDPEAIKELLQNLTPQSCIFTLKAPAKITGIIIDKKEPWLQVDYSVKPITEKKLHEWYSASPTQEIQLPGSNPFLPKNLEVLNSPNGNWNNDQVAIPSPEIILNNEKGLIYYSLDKAFHTPKVSWHLQFRTPAINSGDPEKLVMTDLFVKFVKESLNTFSYNAQIAGLDFTIERKDHGIMVTVSGYNDKADMLILEIVRHLKNIEPTEPQFRLLKDTQLRKYQNLIWRSPLQQSVEVLKEGIYKYNTPDRKKASALRKVKFSSFYDYSKDIFTKTYLEGMIYGNIAKQKAQETCNEILIALRSLPYPIKEHVKQEVINLPDNKGPFYIQAKIKPQGNATLLAIEEPAFSFKNRAAQQILMTAISEPFFTELRTKQQTGYSVYTQAEEIEKKLWNIFIVQSNTHSPRDLLARFEQFIEGYLREMGETELTKEKYGLISTALLKQLETFPKSSAEMGELLNTLAFKFEGDFNWITKRKQGFKELTYEEFLAIAKEMLGKSNKRRVGILLIGSNPESDSIDYVQLKNADQLRKIGRFRS